MRRHRAPDRPLLRHDILRADRLQERRREGRGVRGARVKRRNVPRSRLRISCAVAARCSPARRRPQPPCAPWPEEPKPLPTVRDADALRARWAALRVRELDAAARAIEDEDPARARSLWQHAACIAPSDAELARHADDAHPCGRRCIDRSSSAASPSGARRRRLGVARRADRSVGAGGAVRRAAAPAPHGPRRRRPRTGCAAEGGSPPKPGPAAAAGPRPPRSTRSSRRPPPTCARRASRRRSRAPSGRAATSRRCRASRAARAQRATRGAGRDGGARARPRRRGAREPRRARSTPIRRCASTPRTSPKVRRALEAVRAERAAVRRRLRARRHGAR